MRKLETMPAKKIRRGKESSASTTKTAKTHRSDNSKKHIKIEDITSQLSDNLDLIEYLRISKENNSTTDVLSDFEKTNLIALRAKQIEETGETYINPADYGFTCAEEIAEKELELGKSPFLIRRKISNKNIVEYLNPNEMIR